MKHVAVICCSIDDFLNWKEEQKHNTRTNLTRKYVFDGTMYICISNAYHMRGYSFDEVVETEKSTDNPQYSVIMDNIKPCIKPKPISPDGENGQN